MNNNEDNEYDFNQFNQDQFNTEMGFYKNGKRILFAKHGLIAELPHD
jgi:hypothetical protein